MFGTIITGTSDVLVFVILFGVTIFVHELGHFLVALRLGFVVETFSIGFGPAIWKKTVRGVTYKIGWIPFGGYVSLPQLDPSGMAAIQGSEDKSGTADVGGKGKETTESAEKKEQKEKEAKPAKVYPVISPWKKIAVSVAGGVGNIIFAVLLAYIIYWSPDVVQKTGDTRVGYVATNSVAYSLGLRAGEQVTAVNGKTVGTWYDYSVECLLAGGGSNEVTLTVKSDAGLDRQLTVPIKESQMGIHAVEGVEKPMLCMVMGVVPGSSAEEAGIKPDDIIKEFAGIPVVGSQHFTLLVGQHPDEEVPVVLDRDGKRVELKVRPRFNAEHGRALVGVSVGSSDVSVMPWMQYKNPWDQLKYDAMGIVRILKALVTPKESKQAAKGLGGPVMIFIALWAAIKISFLNGLGFIRFLNVNLAILNLLPIPVLDGGHIIFSLWEGITRRRVHPTLVNMLVNAFAILLIGAMVLLTYRDILRVPRFFRAARDRAESEDSRQATNTASSAAQATNVPAAGAESPFPP